MVVSPSPKPTAVRAVQPEKALDPREITLSGSRTLTRPVFPLEASAPTACTVYSPIVSGTTMFPALPV